MAGNTEAEIGSEPPALSLSRMIQGPDLIQVNWDNLKGNVVMLEFWSTRCAPCIAAIPHLDALVEKFDGRPVKFLSITGENPDHVQDFLRARPIKTWVAIDGFMEETSEAFNVRGIPCTVLVGTNGMIAAITHPSKLGPEHIEELLAGHASSLEPLRADSDKSLVDTAVPGEKKEGQFIRGPFPQPDGAYGLMRLNHKDKTFTGDKAFLGDVIARLFEVEAQQVTTQNLLPDGLYDVSIRAPDTDLLSLQAAFLSMFESVFNLTVKTGSEPRPVYLMNTCSTNGTNIVSVNKAQGGGQEAGGFSVEGLPMRGIGELLADSLGVPVIDETGAIGFWKARLRWNMVPAERLPAKIMNMAVERKVLSECCGGYPDPKMLQQLQKLLDPDDFDLLTIELKKLPEKRFRPDVNSVIQAAREQLGLDLILTNRNIPVVEVVPATSYD